MLLPLQHLNVAGIGAFSRKIPRSLSKPPQHHAMISVSSGLLATAKAIFLIFHDSLMDSCHEIGENFFFVRRLMAYAWLRL